MTDIQRHKFYENVDSVEPNLMNQVYKYEGDTIYNTGESVVELYIKPGEDCIVLDEIDVRALMEHFNIK